MRHRNTGRKLGRSSSHRRALYRNMVTSLFEHEQIRTTDAKAKEIRRIAEKCITLGKRGDLHARRRAFSYLRSRAVVSKLFDEISPRYAERPGGYTRIVKLGFRRGDSAPVSLVELVQEPYEPKARPEKKAPAASTAPEVEVAPEVAPEAEPAAEAAGEAEPAAEGAEAEEEKGG